MPALRVTLDGTSTLLRPGRTYTVGRTPEADLTLTRPSCSRRHAEIAFTEHGWQLTDVGSQHGTYVGGQRIQQTPLAERTTVWFSLPEDGTAVVFEPVADRPGGGGAVPESSLQETVLPSSNGTDASLILRWDGRDYFFSRGAAVRIGREDAADLVVSHPSVSRQHAVVFPDGDGWGFEDASRSGSYVNGRRVQRLALTGPTTVRLGDPTTGAELLMTPVLPPGAPAPGHTPGGAGKTLLAAGAALVVLAVLVVVGWQVGRDEDASVAATPLATTDDATDDAEPPSDPGLTQEELTRAKLATVMLTARSTDGEGNAVAWGGSGSLLTADGLILTNAHVAAPQSMGLAAIYGPDDTRDPDYLLVSLTRENDDLPAAPTYRAEVVVSDGRLDISLLRIVSTATGAPLPDQLDLPTVPVGSSDELKTGDNLTVLGFPSISDSEALSVTRGIVATFIADPALGSDRAEIDTDARIAPGNSGGMAINDDGELVGVPSAYVADQGVPIVSGRVRPIDLVKPLIAEAEGT